MAKFNQMIVTNVGRLQYAKAMAGKRIVITKVVFGSGSPASQSAASELTSLVRAEITGTIEGVDTTSLEGVAIVTANVNNASLESPLSIKEIGVFCKDPDTSEEVMYAYCYSPNDIDVIPSSGSGTVVWKIRVQLAITNAVGEETPAQQYNSFFKLKMCV